MTVAYDGTDFCGWQAQRPLVDVEQIDGTPTTTPAPPTPPAPPLRERIDLRTVQHVLEVAIRDVVREEVSVLGASRTDSGVHAVMQTAAFTTSDERRGPVDERLGLAVNSRLPEDVVITDLVRTRDDFDPIRDCVSKGYRYSIRTGRLRPIRDRRFVHWMWEELDHAAMHEAARRLVGEHDFASFAAAGHGRESTVRTVFACSVARPEAGLIQIDVSGGGFLYNMVRIIAGTLVDVGKGKKKPADIEGILAARDRRSAGMTMPARGLCLMWMRYPEDGDASCAS